MPIEKLDIYKEFISGQRSIIEYHTDKINEIIDLLNFITSLKPIEESKRVTFCVEIPDSDKAV